MDNIPEEYRRWWADNAPVPYGYCWCGCGEQTPLATRNRRTRFAIKGEPLRYVAPGHGKKPSYDFDIGSAFGHIDILEAFTRSFWVRTKETRAGCLEWMGAKSNRGYGMVSFCGGDQGAHRMAYYLAFGPFSPNLLVCHSCDNPPCCKPDHLFLGTAKDNTHDMFSKNRWRPGRQVARRGSDSASAKLTEEDVRKMRRLLRTGEFHQREIAKRFDMGESQVSRIRRGLAWGWLDD